MVERPAIRPTLAFPEMIRCLAGSLLQILATFRHFALRFGSVRHDDNGRASRLATINGCERGAAGEDHAVLHAMNTASCSPASRPKTENGWQARGAGYRITPALLANGVKPRGSALHAISRAYASRTWESCDREQRLQLCQASREARGVRSG